MTEILFFVFAGFALVGAIGVVGSRNPVHSALFLVLTLVSVAVFFLQENAELLAAVQIIVYAGAILVLYLFVVMLLNLKRDDAYQRQVWIGVGLGAVALGEFIYLIAKANLESAALVNRVSQVTAGAQQGNTEMVGRLLYTKYLFPFEVASLILLVAMIGAILLAKKALPEVRNE